MPTYHYRCSDCGHEFDQFQKFSEDPLRDCPSCGGSVQRVIGAVGVVFKGSGWYITDSRKSSSSTLPATDAKSDAKAETKTETKPETKSETKSEASADSKVAAPA